MALKALEIGQQVLLEEVPLPLICQLSPISMPEAVTVSHVRQQALLGRFILRTPQ